MTPHDLIALAERCEAATGPDNELNEAIAQAVGTYQAPDRGSPYGNWPNHTGSLDAAMTLVPEGWRWVMRQACPDKLNPDEQGFFARLETSDFESVTYGKGECWITDRVAGSEAMCWAATPALALTAAALRAIASQGASK